MEEEVEVEKEVEVEEENFKKKSMMMMMMMMITMMMNQNRFFPRGQWCVLRSPGCSAVVPLSLRDLLDSRWCVSLAVCEEALSKPGQCQRQKQDEH